MAVYDRAVIVGVGLLGGSIGLALRQRELAAQVIGFGRRAPSLSKAESMGAIDQGVTELTTACQQADLIVVCTPVQLIPEYVQRCRECVGTEALITDVGSTKSTITEQLRDVENFCGSHPLAGSDKSGVEFGSAELFAGKTSIVTPGPSTPPALVERTEQLWQSLGSRTLRMTPLEHDAGVAATSHLPHILASALAAGTPPSLLPLAATGWCDTTRVAGGSVELWVQIVAENRQPILDALKGFEAALQDWIEVIRSEDQERLVSLLATGKKIRDSVGN